MRRPELHITYQTGLFAAAASPLDRGQTMPESASDTPGSRSKNIDHSGYDAGGWWDVGRGGGVKGQNNNEEKP